MKKIIIFILINIITISPLKATECDKKLKDEAKKVEFVSKEIVDHDEGHYYYKLIVNNLTPNLFLDIYDDVSKLHDYVYYQDTDKGHLEIDQFSVNKPVNYIVNVMDSKLACDKPLNTLNASTKKLNLWYRLNVCVNNKEYEKCHPFYEKTKEEEKLSNNDFVEEVENYETFKNMTLLEKIFYYIKKYGLYVVLPALLISLGYTIMIINKKKKIRGKNE